ncbi:carbohydrate-binding domain-containing protein [Mucilaginibacter corticis]|uniref:Carbohydrate-binding domain-containing protein n=1 Tax=Mucilaginibacter corticis TaxID=2597670 RepID=A0A556MG04_9SPHI|nr:carbohydrate-binding domain-containing protein [Mucilaginibacter corticis]TSJ38857.1 carbohydrate-binding domain-containing protein [Mucilaginibacter corticis]
MKNKFTPLSSFALQLLFVSFVILAGCSKKNAPGNNAPTGPGTTKIDSTAVTSGPPEGSTETGANTDDLVENSTFTSTIAIAFDATGATITPATTSGVTITQTNGDVIITATASGIAYTVSGTTTNGSVKIYSDKKFELTLNGANITNLDGPAINIQSKKTAFVILADGTTNALADAPGYVAFGTEDQKGTFFSEGQLVFSGTGGLTVAGNYKHAIVSDDYIRIRSGNITVTNSLSDGIHANDAVYVDGGTIKITSGSDGIEAEEGYIIVNDGNININSMGKGITASYDAGDTTIMPYININGGTINIKSLADKGISSKSVLTVNKGNILCNSSDDAFSAATAMYINGGNIYANSSDNDAMDSNGTFTLTGGKVVAVGFNTGESGVDCGTRSFKITGGQLIGIGATTSAPNTTTSTQHSAILGAGTAQIIHIEAADGTEALTFQALMAYTTLVFTSAKLKANTTYNVYTGGSVASGVNFNGLYSSGTYTKGTKTAATFTTGTLLSQIGGTLNTQ